MVTSMTERYPLTKRLEILLTSYIVHVTTALITLPTLIWHISSTHIHDDYGMPKGWMVEFDTTQFTGGRGMLWGFLFVLIPIDCLHSLFALDYFHGLRFERGHPSHPATPVQKPPRRPSSLSPLNNSDSNSTHRSDTLPKSTPIRKPVPLPAHPARTFHPLLTRHLPPSARLLLLTIYDLALSAFLTVHITVFFNLLGVNWDACNDYTPLLPEVFLDPMHTNMTVLERCHSINTDMHVSGGFDIALCCVLLVIHLWHLVFRAWEVVVFGVGKGEEGVGEKQSGAMDGSVETGDWVVMRDVEGRGKSTAGIFRGSCVRERLRGVRNSARDLFEIDEDPSEFPEKVRWNEVLLECLVH